MDGVLIGGIQQHLPQQQQHHPLSPSGRVGVVSSLPEREPTPGSNNNNCNGSPFAPPFATAGGSMSGGVSGASSSFPLSVAALPPTPPSLYSMAPSIRTTPSGGLALDALGPGDGDGAAAAATDLVAMQQQSQQQASPVLNAITPTSHTVSWSSKPRKWQLKYRIIGNLSLFACHPELAIPHSPPRILHKNDKMIIFGPAQLPKPAQLPYHLLKQARCSGRPAGGSSAPSWQFWEFRNYLDEIW